jgi:hypothetical protein
VPSGACHVEKIARASRSNRQGGHFPQYFGFAGFALAPFKASLADLLLPTGWSFIFPKPKTQETTMINIALFGAGRIGKIHAANLVRQPGVRLKYVVDMHLPSGQALAQMYGATVVDVDADRRGQQRSNALLLPDQDHRAIKRIVRPMPGFKSFRCARIILGGIELMHMIVKGQMKSDGGRHRSVPEKFYDLAK